jgi:hypothetical protein
MKGSQESLTTVVLKNGLAAPANHSTLGSRPELLSDAWPTPTALSRVRNEETMEKCLKFRQSNGQTTVPLYLEERVNIEEKGRQEWWGTPAANDANKTPHCEINSKQAGLVRSVGREEAKAWATPRAEMDSGAHRGKPDTLHSQIKAWATPQTRDNRSGGAERWDNPNKSRNLNDQIATETIQNAKLNPRWVEALQGLPIGWTMPNCASPVTIAQTSCASSATE